MPRIAHPSLPGQVGHVGEKSLPVWEKRGWVVDGTPESPAGTARPADSALKPAWVAYAVEHGADVAAAEAMTKADLIEVYGSL